MIVIFVSECERQAVKKSRRILNRYARQIGRRSWLARLSREGLDDIHSALKNASSRQMAVACHRIASRTRTELLWVVGSRRHFDYDGNFAFSSSRRDFLRPPREASPMERLCAYLAELAGLFHDVGKDNAFFQEKLWKAVKEEKSKPVADPVRHELLSLMLAGKLVTLACGVRRVKKAEDKGWLAVFSDLKRVSQLFSQKGELFQQDGSWNVTGKQDPDGLFPLPECKENNVLLWAWLWLLGSHHRLPHGEYRSVGDSEPSLLKASHVRFSENSDYLHDLRLNLQPAKSPSRPWQQDVRWLKRVSGCSERIRHWVANHQALVSDPEWMDAFIRLITHFGRTGMMCADHSVSAKDNEKPSGAETDALIANTAKGGPGSILGVHLFNVGRQANSLTRALWQQHLGMPFIAREDIPAPMRPDAGESAASAFAWQDAACKSLKAVAKAGVDTGFIGFVQAGTGCGKTRACARMMAALSSDVRYTVALGLRTLTLQTGQSYRDELELTRQQVTTMVGESLVTRLQKETEKQGSESRSAWFDSELTIDGEFCDDALPRALADMLEGADKHKQLLVAPVLVCTADHITAAADATRGRHLIATLRVFSADLVLDEIDNYEETALVALGKLVYLAGLAGRRVLLSSATLSPAISESLFQAYFEGYRAYAQRRAIEEPQIATGWFSQFEALCQVKWFRKKDVFSPALSMKKFVRQQLAYAKSLVAAMDTIPVKRSIEWFSLPASCDMKGLVQCIYQAGQTLHHKFAGTDPVTGKQLSFGLIRVSNITPCWQISRLLCEQKSEDQWDHRVVCYHARLSALARWHTEQWLDKALNRKQPDAVWQLPLIRELLDSSSAPNIMIMVVATPVEEVGRDHDFDWGIFEPASTRSGVQSGGRIWRHRQPAGQTDNIVLLPTAIKEILEPGQNAVYQYPGVESNPDYLLSTHQAQALLPEDWQVRLDARHNLITPSDSVAEMTSLEHKKQRDYLLGQASDRLSGKTRDSQAAGYSLSEWSVKPALGFCDRHAFGNPFRTREDKVLYWINENGYWWHMIMNARGQPKDKKDPVSADTQIDSITVPDNRLLMNTIIPAHEWLKHYRVLKDKAYPDASKEYAEQSLLGFEFPHSSNRQSILYHFWLGAIRESIKI